MLLSSVILSTLAAFQVAAYPVQNDSLQDIVTWDSNSLFVRGERVYFYAGEFHPFRLPVPGLWLDVFQKIKALGYTGVSFYTNWALLEGKQGHFTAEGIFALEPFFEAAQTAGIYLVARPGPYINAEVSGGGFPGWLSRNPAQLRTRDPRYLDATNNYVSSIGSIIAKAQITNGGPVILVQVENEYSQGEPPFPDPVYFSYVEKQYRNAGIVVPLISNDNYPNGYFAPGPPAQPGAVNIYGHDSYPIGFDADIGVWDDEILPLGFNVLHEEQSPSTPYAIMEAQGGSWDPWGGYGYNDTALRVGAEYERVFYKNYYSFGVKIFSVYMTAGGTNWGNMGYPQGYTSYDYGAAIDEQRTVTREKYGELKLQANFLTASPAYLIAFPQNGTNGSYTGDAAITTTALLGNTTSFYVVRQAAFNSNATTSFKITLPTSKGNKTIPELGGALSLHGRDSKILVADYDVGGINLLYSSADVYTWQMYGEQRILLLYGGQGEEHEFAVVNGGKASVVDGDDSNIRFVQRDGVTTVHWAVSPQRRIVKLSCNLYVHLLDRPTAYDYWVVNTPNDPVSGNYTNATHTHSALIVAGGYLMRTATVSDRLLYITGDLNATANIEIWGALQSLERLYFNGEQVPYTKDKYGGITVTLQYSEAEFSLPDLSTIGWRVVDSLPEITPGYSDALWTSADLTHSNNTERNLTTPVSLYAADYGYNTGYLLYRGRFRSSGKESFYIQTQGGTAYAHSIWLNSTFVGSFVGNDSAEYSYETYQLPSVAGKEYILTILIDQNGFEENGEAGTSTMKTPRGILDYDLSAHNKSDVIWKLTGNLGGEDYRDRTRGPLNEGGLYAERQGYHLPGAPIDTWNKTELGLMDGSLQSAGVAFYATTFDLDIPRGYDIPISVSFINTTQTTSAYRCQIYVNGYQFGKYTHNLGPQLSFPVPEGIWDYHGSNYLAVSLWALGDTGARVQSIQLTAAPSIQTAYGPVAMSPITPWEKREGAY